MGDIMDELLSTCCSSGPCSYFQTYTVNGTTMGVCINCMDHAEFKEIDDEEE
tara:strand:+ start:208 stop:363 length:156 start_codon:yes stop_codon:yes gene_type:complete